MLSVIKNRFNLVSTLFMMVLVTTSNFAADENNLKNKYGDEIRGTGLVNEVGTWVTGYFDEAAIDEQRSLAFISSGGKILIFDISNASSPVLLNENIIGAGIINDIFYDSTVQHLYLAEGYHGVEIWDVSNENAPQKLSSMILEYYGSIVPAEQLTSKPGYIFVTAGYGGLITLDISDPSDPFLSSRDTFLNSYGALDINDAGDVIVATGFGGTVSFSVLPNGVLNEISSNNLYEQIGGSAVRIHGDYSYQISSGYLYVMYIYAVGGSNGIPLPGTQTNGYSVSISGNTLYNTDPFYGIEVFDISNPTSPVFQGSYQTHCNDVEYFSNHVIVPDVTGMKILDVSNPSSPSLTYTYEGIGGYAGYGMKVNGDYCYYPLGRGLHIIDISNPTSPVFTAVNEPSSGSDFAAAFNGNYAYVTNSQNGFRVVDISDPTNPVTVGNGPSGNYTQIIYQENYIYIRDGLTLLRIFDVSNPAAPVQVSQFSSFPSDVWNIALSGNYLYATNGSSGLIVVDVSDPAQPQFVTQYGQNKDYQWITIKDNYAYVTNIMGFGSLFNGVDVLDISNPANPVLAGTIHFSSEHPAPWFDKVLGNILFVGDSDPYMTYIDISDPADPTEITNGLIPDTYRGLDIANGYIFFGTRNDGLHIYEDPFGITPVELSSFTATVDKNNITLNWKTASETNNSGFEIQRAEVKNKNSKIINWKKIGFIEGNGTSTIENTYSFIDKNLETGNYSYRLVQIDFDGTRTESKKISVEVNSLPVHFSLSQNYPNPFNPSTTIEYSVPVNGAVKLQVYNSLGEEIKTLVNGYKEAGTYEANFNASRLSSGIYYYKIESGNFTSVKKMIFLK
jgi:hypothetical protein